MQLFSRKEILQYFEELNQMPAEQLLAIKLRSTRPYSRDQEDAIRLMDYLGIQMRDEVFQILDNNLQEPVFMPKVQYFAQKAFEQYQMKLALQKAEPVLFPDEPIRGQEGESMKNEPQLDLDLNWMSYRPIERFKEEDVTTYLEAERNHNLTVLEEHKNEAFKRCSSFEKALWILLRYAEEVNLVEEEYYDITHLDAAYTPAGVDEIAFQHREELRPFAEPDTDLTLAVAKALKKADNPLRLLERQKDVYEKIQVLPEKIQNQFKNLNRIECRLMNVDLARSDYIEKLEPIEEELTQRKEEQEQLEQLPRFLKFWKRGRLQHLTEEIGQLEKEAKVWKKRIKRMNKVYRRTEREKGEKVINPEGFHYPWENQNRFPSHSIRTEEDVKKTIEEIRQYGKQPEVQEAYRAAVRILNTVNRMEFPSFTIDHARMKHVSLPGNGRVYTNAPELLDFDYFTTTRLYGEADILLFDAVQQPEFPSFAEERERNRQASFPEKENGRAISSELERDREDFAHLR